MPDQRRRRPLYGITASLALPVAGGDIAVGLDGGQALHRHPACHQAADNAAIGESKRDPAKHPVPAS